jgi:hypothetical protein
MPLQEAGLIDLTGHVPVDDRLEARLDPFHAEREPAGLTGHAAQYLELKQVVLVGGMRLADVYDTLIGDLCH